VLLNKINK